MDQIKKNYDKAGRLIVPWCLVLQLVLLQVVFLGTSAMNLPKICVYFMDLLVLLSGFLSMDKILKLLLKKKDGIVWYIVLMLSGTFFLFLINGQSILYYLWGLRNTFRFFLFFLICICWIDRSMIRKMRLVYEGMLYLNVVACSIQFFFFHMPMDNINGFFGITPQGSSFMNVLLVIVTVGGLVNYLHTKIAPVRFLAILGSCVYIAILSELKAYYFELALVLGLAFLLIFLQTKKLSRKLLSAFLFGILGMILIAVFVVKMNPEYWEGFFLKGGFIKEVTRAEGYSGQNDLNRLTAIPVIFRDFFDGGWKALIGFGLGNCDYSNFSFLITPFYQAHESLHYVWLHSAFLFLETGFAGLAFYLSFFLLSAGKALRNFKDCDEADLILNQEAFIVSICCLFFFFYDMSLRIESAYMIFSILAVPYYICKEKGKAR